MEEDRGKEWLCWRSCSLSPSKRERERNCKWSYLTPNTSSLLRLSPSHGKLGKLARKGTLSSPTADMRRQVRTWATTSCVCREVGTCEHLLAFSSSTTSILLNHAALPVPCNESVPNYCMNNFFVTSVTLIMDAHTLCGDQ